ncbi:MAG: hypothetical protein IT563_05995 [Alphaproteobacteria bacterium]|nr:hypothetical protein [Alphaproteobacteria bacterium]
MNQATATFALSVFGAFTATALAVIRIYEFVQDRRLRLDLVAALNTDEQIGHKLVLLNASKTPTNAHYMDLVWVERRWFTRLVPAMGRVVSVEWCPDGEPCNVTVPANSQRTLTFDQADHFSWGAGIEHDLYLRLWLVGRHSPKWLWVTGPG